MSEWKLKRFWTEATVAAEQDGFAVRLDGKPVRTPAKASLVVPTRDMAGQIAAEWNAQNGEVRPDTMPFTRSANAAIDKVMVQRAEVIEIISEYGDSDLICYRAEGPVALVQRQADAWDPYLGWASDALNVQLRLVGGLMHQPQSPDDLAALTQEVSRFNDFELVAFHDLVSLSGSLVLGFAAARNAWPAEAVWSASRLDEEWQIEQWGHDEDAAQVAAGKRREFLHAKAFFDTAR